MRYGIKPVSELKKRMDVNFHLAAGTSIGQSWCLSEIKETIVRDPNCYGFKYCECGVPIIRIGGLGNPFIDFTNVAKINQETHEQFNKTHLRKYDILMSVRGMSIGQIGLFLGEFNDSNISPNIIIIRLKDKELAPYVAMILVSEVGQSQIKRIMAGTSKPTITAPLINRIAVPTPTQDLFAEVNELFRVAEQSRAKAKQIIQEIAVIFETELGNLNVNKEVSYRINFSSLGERWDSHYHNPSFQELREFIDRYDGGKFVLSDRAESISEVSQQVVDQRIGYVEINSVNNVFGTIESYTTDYPKKLPRGGKIEIENGDILISKVRPYRNAIAIYRQKDSETVTASKNAFAVYRTTGVVSPYYTLTFLRSLFGLNQIVMKQSGTTYPTVSTTDINTVEILLMEESKMEIIESLYSKYLTNRDAENGTISTILDLLKTHYSPG